MASVTTVVLGKGSTPLEAFAGEELSSYLERLSGISVSITISAQRARKHLGI